MKGKTQNKLILTPREIKERNKPINDHLNKAAKDILKFFNTQTPPQ